MKNDRRTGLLRENVRMALQSLLATKLRSFLTLLGIMIGVGTVVAMVTVITGLGHSMRRQIASLGSGVLYVSKHEPGIHFDDGGEGRRRKDLTVDDAGAIRETCASVGSVSPEIQILGYASAGGVKTAALGLTGVTENFVDANSWEPGEGRFFSHDEVRRRAPVCVMGTSPSQTLFPHGGALGQWIDLGDRRCQVVGVLKSRGHFLGQDQDNVVLVPLALLAAQTGYGRSVDYLVVRPEDPARSDDARDEITELLRRRRGVRADRPNDFGVTSQENLLELYHTVTGGFFLVTIILSSIGLLVGGIGVMNMMLISVRERTREIGVRVALGARRADVLGQFLTEAVTVTTVGGAFGLCLGFLLAFLIRLSLKVPLGVSPGGLAAAIGVSAGVGLFFGLYPAWRASRLDPIEALRYE